MFSALCMTSQGERCESDVFTPSNAKYGTACRDAQAGMTYFMDHEEAEAADEAAAAATQSAAPPPTFTLDGWGSGGGGLTGGPLLSLGYRQLPVPSFVCDVLSCKPCPAVGPAARVRRSPPVLSGTPFLHILHGATRRCTRCRSIATVTTSVTW